MNEAHIHLLVNHLPVFGSLLGSIVLIYGLWKKSDPTKNAAYILFVLSAIGAGIAHLTGEGAEETVENMQGVAKNMIDQHEDFALFALISLIILGVISIAGIFLTSKKSPYTRVIAYTALFFSLISFSLVARTGYLGGQIRHTEINSAPVATQQENAGDDD